MPRATPEQVARRTAVLTNVAMVRRASDAAATITIIETATDGLTSSAETDALEARLEAIEAGGGGGGGTGGYFP